MKYILFLVFLIGFIGCDHKAPIIVAVPQTPQTPRTPLRHYPRLVKNKCGMWAVVTGIYVGEEVYWGERNLVPSDIAFIPNEYQFNDSLSAWKDYHDKQIVPDSIYECQHAYQ